MKFVFLVAATIANTAILASPLYSSTPLSNFKTTNALTNRDETGAGVIEDSTTFAILRRLRPRYRSDDLTNTAIEKHFQAHEGQKKELARLNQLINRVDKRSMQQFHSVLQRMRADVVSHVGEVCYTIGRCNVGELAQYMIVYTRVVLAEMCAQRGESLQNEDVCKNLPIESVPQKKTGLNTTFSRRALQWPNPESDDGEINPDKITKELENELNGMSNIIIEIECPLDLEQEEFDACVLAQEEPLQRLHDKLPDSFDWSQGRDDFPEVTAATTFGCPEETKSPMSTASPTNPIDRNCPAQATVTVTVHNSA
jgi:hypothetical protein